MSLSSRPLSSVTRRTAGARPSLHLVQRREHGIVASRQHRRTVAESDRELFGERRPTLWVERGPSRHVAIEEGVLIVTQYGGRDRRISIVGERGNSDTPNRNGALANDHRSSCIIAEPLPGPGQHGGEDPDAVQH